MAAQCTLYMIKHRIMTSGLSKDSQLTILLSMLPKSKSLHQAQSPTPRPHVATSESQRERSGVPTGGDALEIASGHTKMGCQPGDCR